MWYWFGLAAIALIPVPFVVWVAYRYGVKARPAAQEVQQRLAELTAEAEENISGVRVVKAFSREGRQLARFRRATERVFAQAMNSAMVRAGTCCVGTTATLGNSQTSLTQAKSRSGLKGRLR